MNRLVLAILACALLVACSRAPAPHDAGVPSVATPATPSLSARSAAQRSQDEINACRGPGGKWMCSTEAPITAGQPTVNPSTWRVAAWVVDGQNVTGFASDSNPCVTVELPCLTATQIQQARWGGTPNLPQATTITALSPYQATDFWSTSPILVGDAGAFAFEGGGDAGLYLPPYGALSDAGLVGSGNAVQFQGVPIASTPNAWSYVYVGSVDGGSFQLRQLSLSDILGGTPDGGSSATAFQNVPIAAGPPTASQVYVGNAGGTLFQLRQLTQDDILPGFSIGSFSVSGGVVEVGATITNPTVAASYSSLPASASVTNTDGHDSPLALTTPFTAGTVTGAFEHSAPATVTFTLTAVSTGGVTKTATATEQWLFRSFAGLGTAGATAATASGSSAVLNDSAGTIASAGLFSSIIGQTFNLSPSGNNVYIVSPTAVSVWRDVNTGLPFAMNAGIPFSFTNQNGVVSTYFLYQSTNPLTGSFGVQAVS
jgi:hypothetical protein